MSDQSSYGSEEARQARDAVDSALDHGQNALVHAFAAAERAISQATKAAERFITESVDALLTHTDSYTEDTMHHFDDGQRYVMTLVRRRPVTSTLAGVGIGVLIGFLLSARSK